MTRPRRLSAERASTTKRNRRHDSRSSRGPRFLDGRQHLHHNAHTTQDRQFSVAKGVVLRANSGNTTAICVGTSDAKNTGYILAAGERTPLLQVDNLNKLFVVATDGEQGYSWFAC